jgi:peptidase M23-like protein/putative serine esterase DUF676
MRRLAAFVAATTVLLPASSAFASESRAPVYRPPVSAPVADGFRPPAEPWGAGNRGLEYATSPGAAVWAAADGEVTFAGQVGGSLHVVVLHADGVRTSYSFLRTIAVRRGERVRQGQSLGTAGDTAFHFGARAGDAYIDPALLFGGGPPQVFLVPEHERRPGSEEHERSGLLGMIAGLPGRVGDAGGDVVGAGGDAVEWAAGAGGAAAGWAVHGASSAAGAALDVARRQVQAKLDELRGLVHYCIELSPPVHMVRLVAAGREWWRQRRHCTPAGVPAPRLHERHVAVLVAGFGSSSAKAAVWHVPTAALGYAPDDVARFSYRGGTTAEHAYSAADSAIDIRASGRRLAQLLERLRAEHPGVPIDILAHSQGGLVTRAALAYEFDRGDRRLPPLGAVVTLGSPHHGTDGATAVAMMRHSPGGRAVLGAVGEVPGVPDLGSVSLQQMAEPSAFIRKLNSRPIPRGVRFTSIGARGDAVVPAGHTRLAGANNVTVRVAGAVSDHDQLPGSPAAQREIALALAGLPPTCRTLLGTVTDRAVSDGVAGLEDGAGAALWGATRAAPVPGGAP